MRRVVSLLMLLALLLPGGVFAEDAALPEQITLAPGESRTFALPFQGYWESDAPEVAQGNGNTLTAYEEGWAVLALISPTGQEWTVEVEVTGDPVPPLIRAAIDLALSEWQENRNVAFPKDKKNKYTIWYCGNTAKCYFGWCGGFANYCMLNAGVPMDEKNDCKPQPGGVPYAVHEAGVGKIYTGFEKMERLSDIPRPGYLVIYGKRDYYAYIHIGMVTDVIDQGNGVYQIFTVEGNVSNRIKRYSYLYDTNAKKERNMSAVPEADRTDTDTFQYTPHAKEWYVNVFCQTWY